MLMNFSNVFSENNWNLHKLKPLNHYVFRATHKMPLSSII
jgi:hypothetical protein